MNFIYKKTFTFFFFLILLSLSSYCQDRLIFNLAIGKVGVDYLVSRGTKENRDFEAIVDFLQEEFGAEVTFTDEQRNKVFSTLSSMCKVVQVGWEINSFKRDLGAVGRYPMKVAFGFCDGQKLIYEFNVNINGYTYDLKMAILRGLRKAINVNDIYEKLYKSNINTEPTIIPQNIIDEKLSDSVNTNNSIIGVYKLVSSSNFSSLEKIAIINIDNKLSIINIENSAFKKDWKAGQLIGNLQSTVSSKYFIGNYKGIVDEEQDISIIYDDNIIEWTFTKSKETRKFIKIN